MPKNQKKICAPLLTIQQVALYIKGVGGLAVEKEGLCSWRSGLLRMFPFFFIGSDKGVSQSLLFDPASSDLKIPVSMRLRKCLSVTASEGQGVK